MQLMYLVDYDDTLFSSTWFLEESDVEIFVDENDREILHLSNQFDKDVLSELECTAIEFILGLLGVLPSSDSNSKALSSTATGKEMDKDEVNLPSNRNNNNIVKVVTNADCNWVRESLSQIFPLLLKYLEYYNIAIISARDLYSGHFPNEPICWKMYSFRDEISLVQSSLSSTDNTGLNLGASTSLRATTTTETMMINENDDDGADQASHVKASAKRRGSSLLDHDMMNGNDGSTGCIDHAYNKVDLTVDPGMTSPPLNSRPPASLEEVYATESDGQAPIGSMSTSPPVASYSQDEKTCASPHASNDNTYNGTGSDYHRNVLEAPYQIESSTQESSSPTMGDTLHLVVISIGDGLHERFAALTCCHQLQVRCISLKLLETPSPQLLTGQLDYLRTHFLSDEFLGQILKSAEAAIDLQVVSIDNNAEETTGVVTGFKIDLFDSQGEAESSDEC